MKKAFALVCGLVAAAGLSLNAQPQTPPQGPPPQGPKKDLSKDEMKEIATRQADELDRQLNLTDKQEKKVYKLFYKQIKEENSNSSQDGRPDFNGGQPGGPMPGGPRPGGAGNFGGQPGGPGFGGQGNFNGGQPGGAPGQGQPGGRPDFNGGQPRPQMRPPVSDEFETKLQKILTEEQFNTWNSLKLRDQDRKKEAAE